MEPRHSLVMVLVLVAVSAGRASAEPLASTPRASGGGTATTPEAAPGVSEEEAAESEARVTVRGVRPSGYTAHGQTTGSRAARPVSDVPQSITVVPARLLSDTGAQRIEDAVALTPSVQLGAGFGLLWEDYYIRGSRVWSGTMYRNGYLGGFSGLSATDAVNVQRVEILRGPAAALYGPGLPGGSINVITKRPAWNTEAAATLGVGSWNTRRATLDATGAASPGVALRMTAAFDETDGYRDFNHASRVVANPSALMQLSKDTRLFLETQAFRVRYRPDSRGVPILGGDPFALPEHRSLIEPDTPLTRFDGMLFRAELEHQVSDDVVLRFGVQGQRALQDEQAVVFLGLQADGRTLDRLPTHYQTNSADLALQASVEWRLRMGAIEHDIVGGTDLRAEHVGWRIGVGTGPSPIDVYAPEYGTSLPAVAEQTGPDNEWTYRDAGVYLNDVIRLTDPLRVVVGARADRYDQRSTAPSVGVNERAGEVAFSGRGGALYDWSQGISSYASVSRGFWPVLGISADATLLDPERSVGTEVGTRFAAPRDLVAVDLSVFQTWNQHTTLPNPSAPDFQVQRNRTVSRGVEVFTTAQPARVVRLIASYTLADARVTRDDDPQVVNQGMPFVPRHAGGGWISWDVPLGARVLELGGGFRAVGERPLNDGTLVPGYVRVDSAVGLRVPGAKLSLFTRNILGERYVQSGNDASSVLFGAPRTFLLNLTATL